MSFGQSFQPRNKSDHDLAHRQGKIRQVQGKKQVQYPVTCSYVNLTLYSFLRLPILHVDLLSVGSNFKRPILKRIDQDEHIRKLKTIKFYSVSIFPVIIVSPMMHFVFGHISRSTSREKMKIYLLFYKLLNILCKITADNISRMIGRKSAF